MERTTTIDIEKRNGATELELRIVKAFFSVDEATRSLFLTQFRHFLAGETEGTDEV